VAATSVDIHGLRGRWLAQDGHEPDAGDTVSLGESLEEMRAYDMDDAPDAWTWYHVALDCRPTPR
jgi:hypothetical protein